MKATEAAALLTICAAYDNAFHERFWAKVEKTETCWNWTAADDGYGYGAVGVGPHVRKAHRVAYELTRGEIPAGMLIDHKCHNRRCVNPDHLQVATSKENLENRQGANKNSKSGVRGVSWSKTRRKWLVVIGHNRRSYYGGMYDTIAEAETAAVDLRSRLFTNNLTDRSAS